MVRERKLRRFKAVKRERLQNFLKKLRAQKLNVLFLLHCKKIFLPGTAPALRLCVELIKNQQAQHEAQLKLLANQIANQNVLIRQLVTEKKESEEVYKIFPLQKEEDMLSLEEAIDPETRQIYVTAMKTILAPVGIKKGLPRILSDTIVEQYNIHGVKQKKAFLSLPKFYRALLDSIPDSSSGDVEEDLRLALMAHKKNYCKKKYLKRKAEMQ
ncbi:hypothetical protein ACLKA7_000029 [Drosophila subpalustris]